ncbi:hypothetical protein Tco_1424780, partial [Tanacetum coccineum]
RKEEISLIYTLFLDEYKCSSLALEREGRDEKKRLDHLKQDQEMLVIKIFSERKKVFRERKKCEKIRAKSDDKESNHEDASDTGAAPKQQQQVRMSMIYGLWRWSITLNTLTMMFG